MSKIIKNLKAEIEAGLDLEEEMLESIQTILDDYDKDRDIDNMDVFDQPDQGAVIAIIEDFLRVLFPGYYRDTTYRTFKQRTKLSVMIEDALLSLSKQIKIALLFDESYADLDESIRSFAAQKLSIEFSRQIPKIREYINTDIQATFDGDPAASSKDEIILAYPGLYATAIYRLAHELHLLNIPLLPRMMTEYAHRETGVDIHPGAKIGKYFFIDHATGVVVGSTSVIGEHVKVYQGVTIGALSTKEGHAAHGTRRHPTIEDNVTLYSGATILGGNTVIGEGAVIGGNTFVTKSVPPHASVVVQTHETVYKGE